MFVQIFKNSMTSKIKLGATKIVKITILFLIIAGFSSCSNKVVDIKSPCVSKSGGPCGPKKPINDWWLKDYHKYQS